MTTITTKNETIQSRIDELKAKFDEELVWGVRWDAEGLPVGHIFECSRRWYDNELVFETVDGETEEVYLPGTSVLQDGYITSTKDLYVGTPYIVCGYLAEYGEDCGEVVLKECEIMEIA